MRKLCTIAFLCLIFPGCKPKEDLQLMVPYDGPLLELENTITYYSDSSVVKMKMEAARQLEFENGDREFPDGIYLEFYDTFGNLTSTMRADYCYFTRESDLYKASGDVVIKGYSTHEQLNTEELYWNQKEEKVFTDKFVRIEKEGEIHTGEGLEAKQDFSEYRILKSRGTILLPE
jgi:LPS export ABC transporter protein LptC